MTDNPPQLIHRDAQLLAVRGWPPDSGVIDEPLRDKAIDRRDTGEQVMREARTHYRRLAITEIPEAIEGYASSRYSLIELQPETGRQHQLSRSARRNDWRQRNAVLS